MEQLSIPSDLDHWVEGVTGKAEERSRHLRQRYRRRARCKALSVSHVWYELPTRFVIPAGNVQPVGPDRALISGLPTRAWATGKCFTSPCSGCRLALVDAGVVGEGGEDCQALAGDVHVSELVAMTTARGGMRPWRHLDSRDM